MLIRAPQLDTPTSESIRFEQDGALVLDADEGTIVACGSYAAIRDDFPEEPEWAPPEGARPLLLPGLIDVHAHLPQYPAVARRESSLLPWLERHVFPLEREFSGNEHAAFIEAFFDDVAANGITTIVLYGAIWEGTTDLAFGVAKAKGIRAIIGKVMMDVGSYGEEQSVVARDLSMEQSRRLIEKWHGAEQGRLEYAMAPRFAVTCSMDLMREAGELAAEFDTYVQTHLSENRGEIEVVAGMFPEAASYTDVYRQAGLLGPRTILGHCIHLSDDERRLLAEAGATIAHCPTSNFFLNSGLFPLDLAQQAGIRVGLASDVAGGPELNPWQVMRSAIEVQKARGFHDERVAELSPAHAFHLATSGGADLLGKADRIGTLDIGMEADLSLIDLNRVLPLGGRYSPADLDPEQLLTACIYRGGPDATLASFVRGRRTH